MNQRMLIASVVVALTLGVLTAGVYRSYVGRASEELLVAESTYSVQLAPEDAVGASDAVVRGTVRQVKDDRWTTPDGDAPAGLDPSDPSTGRFASGHTIYRRATVEVTEALKGTDVPASIVVYVPGGTRGGVRVVAEDSQPQLEEGQDVVLFVFRADNGLWANPPESDLWVSWLAYEIEGVIATNDYNGSINVDDLYSIIHQGVDKKPTNAP